MARLNRKPITVRLNQEFQKELAELCAFHQRSEKDVLRLALALMVESTKQLKAQREEQANASAKDDSVGSVDSDSSSNAVGPSDDSGQHREETSQAGATD